MGRRYLIGFVMAITAVAVCGCSRVLAIRTNPADARVLLDGVPVNGNAIEYGRWIGNRCTLRVEADGYAPAERTLDVRLPSWAVVAVGPLWWPWMGELPSQLYVELQRTSEKGETPP